MKRELNRILSILQGKRCEVSNFDWYYTLGFLILNRIAISFYRAASDNKVELPKSVHAFLETLSEQQIQRNNIMEHWIADVSYELKGMKAPYAFLKGSVLSYCTFGGRYVYTYGERISNDIDILVSPKDLGELDQILTDFGFVQGAWKDGRIVPFSRREIVYRRMTRGETAPYLIETQSKMVPFIELDVNYSLGYHPDKDLHQVEDLLRDVKPYQFVSRETIYSLTEEKFLLHLIMHQYKEATLYWMVQRNKDSQLYKYLDIYRLLSGPGIDRKRFVSLVKEQDLGEETAYVLTLCYQLFHCNAIYEVLQAIGVNQLAVDLDKVDDAENRTTYQWTKGIFERVGKYDKCRYLKKV